MTRSRSRRARGGSKRRPTEGTGRHGPTKQSARARRNPVLVNVLLAAVVAGGAIYLAWSFRQSEQDVTFDKDALAPGQGAGDGYPRTPPEPVIETLEDGTQVARIDQDRLAAWCAAWNLPVPPDLAVCEPVVARTLVDALRAAAASRSPAALGRLGQICESLDGHHSAEQYFKLAWSSDRKNFRWPYYLGCIYQLTGRSNEAIEMFQRVLALEPDYALTHARLGQLYLQAEQLDDAAKRFQRYREMRPRDCLGYAGLGRVALQRGKPDVAVQYLLRAVERGPNDFQSHHYLAQAYVAKGNREKAREHFDACSRLPRGKWFHMRDPLDQELHRTIESAQALSAQFERLAGTSDWARLIELGLSILERRPTDTVMMGNLASFYRKQKQHAQAHQILDRALRLRPGAQRLLRLRAEVFLAESKFAAALQAADEVLAKHAEDGRALSVRARALLYLDRPGEAQSAMERVLDLDPNDTSNLFALGEILRARGKIPDAIACYRKVLKLNPHHAPARQRLQEYGAP